MRGPPEGDGTLVRVDGYGPTGFTISGRRHQGPVILRANEVVAWAGFSESGLEEAAARDLLADFQPPGIVLVGTGQNRVVPGTSFLAWFRTRGFEPDLMVTGAACRTWNVLAMEGREVIAGLIPSGWGPGQETES